LQNKLMQICVSLFFFIMYLNELTAI